MRPKRLTESEVSARLSELPQWTLRDAKLHRELELGSFVAAFGLMAKMALVSEKLDHHPEWFNVYSRLVIQLTTHDAGGISELDFTWALELERQLDATR